MGTFELNSFQININEITSFYESHESEMTESEKDVVSFLLLWFDEKDFIEVKTSGSTGEPKLIKLPKETMRKSAQTTLDFFSLKPGMTALLALPVSYIAGKMMVVRALEGDLRLKSIDVTSDITPFLKSLPEEELIFDFCALIPMQIEKVLANNELKSLNKLRNIIVGGAPLNETTIKALKESQSNIFITYGMTETASHVALKPVSLRSGFENKSVSLNNLFYSLPDIGFTTDQRGCLVIGAPKLINDKIVTNDIVEIFDKNHFIWKGRYDNVINSGGIKLFPEEVERKLSGIIRENYFLTKEPDELLGERMIMVIEGVQPDEKQIISLKESIKKLLGKYEMPKRIVYLTKFSYTENGKIKRVL